MKCTALALALAASALAASPAYAQEPSFDGAKVIDSLDDATLKAAITAIGGTTAPLDDEDNTLRIAYPNGMRGVARRMACSDADACRGLILLGYFTLPEDASPERTQQALSQFGFVFGSLETHLPLCIDLFMPTRNNLKRIDGQLNLLATENFEHTRLDGVIQRRTLHRQARFG